MSGWALIVDDDEDNRELLVEFLELAGYPVASCGSAADADRILDARGKPGVVVSDVRLPDMNGPTFVDAMKRRPGFEDTPVIFVTGAQGNELGTLADPVLTKPFDPEVLVKMVSRFCSPMVTASVRIG
jgi:CheY-like chemotaxis protein